MTLHQHQPTTDRVARVEFALSDADYPFVAASTIGGCQAFLEEIIPRGDGIYAEFFAVFGVDPGQIDELAAAHDAVEATLLSESESGGLFEFEVGDSCPAVFLGEHGALPRRVYSENGTGHIRAEIRETADAGRIVDEFLAAYPEAELTRKREQPCVTPMFPHRRYQHVIGDQLTDRQLEVLTAAHEMGYYDWPREITAKNLASHLDISTSTLLKHLRSVERKFIAAFFECPDFDPDEPAGAH